MNQMESIKFIDLFCGLGSFHCVLKRYNTQCVFACDIDEGVRKIYNKNYHFMPHGDINDIDINNIPEHDLLCAGFPCQSFSIAGKKQGFDDIKKGKLFFKVLDIIDAKHPPMVILENVKNIMTIDNGNTFKRIVSELENREYKVSFKLMNSVYYGSPQCRERVFIVALLGNESFEFPNDDRTNIKVVKDILDPEAALSNNILEKYKMEKIETKGVQHKPSMIYKLINKTTGKGGRQGERVYDVLHPGATICASSGGPGAKTGLYLINNKVRRLNAKECLKMFGFPDDYIFDVDDNKMIFYLGNSIVTNVIDAIIKKLAIASVN